MIYGSIAEVIFWFNVGLYTVYIFSSRKSNQSRTYFKSKGVLSLLSSESEGVYRSNVGLYLVYICTTLRSTFWLNKMIYDVGDKKPPIEEGVPMLFQLITVAGTLVVFFQNPWTKDWPTFRRFTSAAIVLKLITVSVVTLWYGEALDQLWLGK